MTERRQIKVKGIVQGVGFRPFVYGLAQSYRLAGFVLNNSAGVTIELEGEALALNRFLRRLSEQPPPLARIEQIACSPMPLKGEADFRIVTSQTANARSTCIAADASPCGDCLRELFNPRDRRYRYPFINCTHCGPRFTIATNIPYDRAHTTMAGFEMCQDCRREYHDPPNRRFHAQPNACPVCGPRVRLVSSDAAEAHSNDALVRAAQLLLNGKILAVKGLGGYHLACNAMDNDAVARLRNSKHREDKPFALMARDVDQLRRICRLEAAEERLLCSRQRPIVLLRKYHPSPIAEAVAPAQSHLGVMLPYTPLHHLLLADCDLPLVMTSGNLSDEPIAFDDRDARQRLSAIADYFLLHDRPIHMRCDDSVARVIAARDVVIRRSRGYAPQPIPIAQRFLEPTLACGAELKNTFCLGKDDHAFLSHHIGDLANYDAYKSYVRGIEHYRKLFDIRPTVVAHDLHPQYLSTQYAKQLDGVSRIAVQHHHAHIASCMAEHDLTGPVIGVAFDGLGYGADGAIWGGEFLIADFAGYERAAHLRYIPLAGGDAAIRQPWRSAVSYLRDALDRDPRELDLPNWQAVAPKQIELVQAMTQRGLNTVRTSSCGRLFDAVASIVGLRHEVHYEGQAAIELEAAVLPGVEDSYPFEVSAGTPMEIDLRPAIVAIVGDLRAAHAVGWIAAKLHNSLAGAIIETCRQLRARGAPRQVCLSGGAFQNVTMVELLVPAFQRQDFQVFFNGKVPTNDGGIAFGQALVANEIIRRGGSPCVSESPARY